MRDALLMGVEEQLLPRRTVDAEGERVAMLDECKCFQSFHDEGF
jgi:hypothetical protein